MRVLQPFCITALCITTAATCWCACSIHGTVVFQELMRRDGPGSACLIAAAVPDTYLLPAPTAPFPPQQLAFEMRGKSINFSNSHMHLRKAERSADPASAITQLEHRNRAMSWLLMPMGPGVHAGRMPRSAYTLDSPLGEQPLQLPRLSHWSAAIEQCHGY